MVYFSRPAEHLIHADWITRAQQAPHTWVTAVSRKHISHVLKTLQYWQVLLIIFIGERWLHTALFRSLQGQHEATSKQAHIEEAPRGLKTNIWLADFLPNLVHSSAIKIFCFVTISLRKSGFTPLRSGNLVSLCMTLPNCTTRVSNVTLQWEGGRHHEPAASFQKQETPQPLTVHILLVEREVHVVTTSGTVSRMCFYVLRRETTFRKNWWNNFKLAGKPIKTSGSETNALQTSNKVHSMTLQWSAEYGKFCIIYDKTTFLGKHLNNDHPQPL